MPSVRRDAPCAFPLEKKDKRRLIRLQTTDGRSQISKAFSPRWTEKEIPPKIPSRMEHKMLTNMDGERVKGSPKERTEIGHQRITRSKAEIQKSGEKGGKEQGKSANQDDSKVKGNPLYTETPAKKTFGINKDSGGRGKDRSNEFNPHSNTSNNKSQGGKKGGRGKSFGGLGRGKGVNAVERAQEWVDKGQVQDVQPNGEEEWQ